MNTLFGIPADIMGANPPPVDIPFPTESVGMPSSVDLTMDMVKEGIEAANSLGEDVPEIAVAGPPPEAPVTMSAEEEAAMKFTKLLPFVSKLADAMQSKGGLVRVMSAMAEFPLGATKPRLLNDAERQLFHVLQELNGYKSTVITSILQKNAEMEKMKQTAVSTTAETDENNGGN